MRELIDVLTARALPTDLWGLHPATFGVGAEDQVGAVEIDVRGHARRKLAALRCHRTQLAPDHLLTALPDDLAAEFLGCERWRHVAGPDTLAELLGA
jgi:LmbE family N-acetylglucosaminyl deacetylase